MSASHNVCAQNSSAIAPRDGSPTPVSDRPEVKRPSNSKTSKPLQGWFETVRERTNEMATDEEARQKVAHRLK